MLCFSLAVFGCRDISEGLNSRNFGWLDLTTLFNAGILILRIIEGWNASVLNWMWNKPHKKIWCFIQPDETGVK